jgi:hypothetical protein
MAKNEGILKSNWSQPNRPSLFTKKLHLPRGHWGKNAGITENMLDH